MTFIITTRHTQDIIVYDEFDRNMTANQSVYVPLAGRVILVNNSSLEHSLLRIRVSKDFYYYTSHLAPGSISVKPGQTVRTGQVVGRMGKLKSMVPHMHIEFTCRHHVSPELAFREYRGADGRVVHNGLLRQGEYYFSD